VTAQVIAKTMDYLNNLALLLTIDKKRWKIFIRGNLQSQEGIEKVWKERI
jgi:hypothetical protein